VSSPVHSHRPELLAPAGDWEALRAAVANGADAVYFGLSNFNARYRATNFTLDELPEVMSFLHARNVRGYVAFNTLIFSDELAEAARFVATIAEAGADAVIVQDLGLARLLTRVAPSLPIHGSTQMTLTEPRGIEFVRKLGVERVILARELSIDDIAKIAGQTAMPLEVFVHGALCVAYSGQCLTSEALGGRSANRGQCAQACRMPYELVVNGETCDVGDRAYLLSPLDLAAYDLIEPLVGLGVACFKIEGRLKGGPYVAAATQAYRAAIDAATTSKRFQITQQQRLDLQQTYSRGFAPGFLGGVNHQQLVPARFPKARGVRIGRLVEVSPRGCLVALDDSAPADYVKPGDGLVFDESHPEEQEQGGRVVEITARGTRHLLIRFAEETIDSRQLSIGAIVWKTDDPATRRRLAQSYSRDKVPHRVPIDFTLKGTTGGPLSLEARDDNSRRAIASWPGPLEIARRHPITAELLREQLGRLGDTPFELGDVINELPADAIVPKSVLNDLRRQAVDQLLAVRRAELVRTVNPTALDDLRSEIVARTRSERPDYPRLHVLVRSMAQLDAVLARRDSPTPDATIHCDFEDVRRYRDAVARARDAGRKIGLATLRIIKPGEEGLLSLIARADADCILIRNLAGLTYFKQHAPGTPLVGDFSLNVANEITADLFIDEGLTRLVPSYDLAWDQLAAMLRRTDAGRFEIVIHQHMPMFHMEHCVFAAMLSNGKDWRDCGRPCDSHRVELRDRVGAEFPLMADTGCRNTVFNSIPQSAAEYVPQMLALGVRHFRVEFLRENPQQIHELLDHYHRVLSGDDTGRVVFRQLNVLNQLGVTRGTLART
jgi:putative protease